MQAGHRRHLHLAARRKGGAGGQQPEGACGLRGKRPQGDTKGPAEKASKAFPQAQSWARRKPLKEPLRVNRKDPGDPCSHLSPLNSLSLPVGRAWQSRRTRCPWAPWRCCKYRPMVPCPLPAPARDTSPPLQEGRRRPQPSPGHQRPPSGVCPVPPPPPRHPTCPAPSVGCPPHLPDPLLSPHRVLLAKMEKLELRDPPALP